MRTQFGWVGAGIGIAAVLTAFELAAASASAFDGRLTVRPAIHSVTGSGDSQVHVQLAQWRGPYGYQYGGGYYGPFYSGPYMFPYYGPYGTRYPTPYATPYPTPYGTPYYRYPAYGPYGYPSPAYGYPAWGYPAYGGIGVRTGRVGIGIW